MGPSLTRPHGGRRSGCRARLPLGRGSLNRKDQEGESSGSGPQSPPLGTRSLGKELGGAWVSRRSSLPLPPASLLRPASQGRRLLRYLRWFSLYQLVFEFVPVRPVVPRGCPDDTLSHLVLSQRRRRRSTRVLVSPECRMPAALLFGSGLLGPV